MTDNSCSISFRVEAEVRDELFELAKKQDLNVSQLIRRAVKEYIKKVGDEGVDG